MNEPNELVQKMMKVAKGYRDAVIFLTANKMGIFKSLSANKYTVEQIAVKVKSTRRGIRILLNALVNMGFIKKDGSYYSNRKEIMPFLTEDGKYFLGASFEHDFNLLKSWINLPDILKTGKPVRTKEQIRKKDDQESFILAMANSAIPQMKDFYKSMDLSKYKTFLDIGGGPGVYSLFACRFFPKLSSTNFDLPITNNIAKKYLSKFPESKKITLQNGNYFHDEFGNDYDVVLISSIIHSLGEKDIKMLFKKAYSALNKGGMLIVKDFYFNNDRVSPERPAIFAVNMLINTEEGDCYTPGEIKNWLGEAGFKKLLYKDVSSDIQYVQAIK
jgi:hypothetical protein